MQIRRLALAVLFAAVGCKSMDLHSAATPFPGVAHVEVFCFEYPAPTETDVSAEGLTRRLALYTREGWRLSALGQIHTDVLFMRGSVQVICLERPGTAPAPTH